MAKRAKKVSAKGANKATRKAASATTKSKPARTLAAKKQSTPRASRISVDQHATEKLIQLAAACFGSGAAASSWFEYPKQRLAGKSPKQACRSSVGREQVRAWLEEIADGAFA
jgi:uncharacterized protein (DUF2384 family)